MKKCRFWAIILLLGVLVVFSVGASEGAPQLKVQKALGVTGAPDVHQIPVGSTITHLPDGSTTVTGPDGMSVISAQSSEAGLVSTPQGMARATRVYEVPSGSFVHGASPDTIEVYDADGKVILTVIDEGGEAGLEAAQTVPAAYPMGWIEDAEWIGPGSFGHLYGQWAIPTTPNYALEDPSVIYLFDGIQGDGANTWAGRTAVLQPVIGYNEDRAQAGNHLNGRVWVVSGPSAQDVFRTDPIGASVGDVIIGAMSYSTDLQFWVSVIRDQNTGNYKVLMTDLLGIANQFVCTALEGYDLDTDSDLFGSTDFLNLQVFDQNGGTIYPSWEGWIDQDALDVFSNLAVVVYDSSHVRLRTNRVPSGLEGFVMNAATGYPVPYAEIRAYQAGQLKGSTTTNLGGHYQIELTPGTYTVTVSHIGFNDKEYTVEVPEQDGFAPRHFHLTPRSPGPIPYSRDSG